MPTAAALLGRLAGGEPAGCHPLALLAVLPGAGTRLIAVRLVPMRIALA